MHKSINLIFNCQTEHITHKPWETPDYHGVVFDGIKSQYRGEIWKKISCKEQIEKESLYQSANSAPIRRFDDVTKCWFISNYGKFVYYTYTYHHSWGNNSSETSNVIFHDHKFKIPDNVWFLIDTIGKFVCDIGAVLDKIKHTEWVNNDKTEQHLINEYAKNKEYGKLYECDMKDVLKTYWQYKENPSDCLSKIMINNNLINPIDSKINNNLKLIKYWLDRDISILKQISVEKQSDET
jgi:hypothetical protein